MAVKFTQAQSRAIETHGRTLLISAAAGSGKTATLTERIIRELTDREHPADISDMLVVTFTRAAAGELRARIGAALSAELAKDPTNRHLSSQLALLGGARICTIDSFYLDVVRENFQRLGLPATFRIADPAELVTLRRECMQNAIAHFYETDPDFPDLADSLSGARGDRGLADIFISLTSKLECLPRGMMTPADDALILEAEAKEPFLKSRAGACLIDVLYDELADAAVALRHALAEIEGDPRYPAGYATAFSYDLDTLSALLEATVARDEKALRQIAADHSPMRLPSIKKGEKPPRADELANIRKKIGHGAISDVKNKYFTMPAEDIEKAQKESARLLRALSRFLVFAKAAFSDEKRTRSVCEFSDIREYAYTLLIAADGSPTPIADSWRERLSEIFVDEYQDTDPVQDAIFRAISRPDSLFMVGDIKQSIYAFRGADPSIFADYRRRFSAVTEKADIAPGAIFMSENFRCSEKIVKFTNAVSSFLFSRSENAPGEHGIGYRPEDDLIFSRGEPGEASDKIELILTDRKNETDDDADTDDSDENDESGEALEVSYITARIASMVNAGTPVGDIAVLARSKPLAAAISSSLSARGIPNANSAGEDLFANPEVLMFTSLLTAIDNPQRDIPLAAAAKSPIFELSLNDLVRVRSLGTDSSLYDSICDYADSGEDRELAKKCSVIIEKLSKWRRYAEAMPVDKLIRRIWSDTSALTYAGSNEDTRRRPPAERRISLQRLYEYARSFNASVFHGLSEFVSHINGMISEGAKQEHEISGERQAVSIMTIHKSKGLEFPIVFLVGMGRRFNRRDAAKDLVFSSSRGMALRLSLGDGISKLDPPMRRAIAAHISALTDEEEIRILYVAMTRAKEKLVITADSGKPGADKLLADAEKLARRGGRTSVIGARSRIHWILAALSECQNASEFCSIQRLTDIDDIPKSDASSIPQTSADDTDDISHLKETLRERIEYTYPYSHLSAIPAKLSVSRLYPGVLDDVSELEAADLLSRVEATDTPERIPTFMSDTADEADAGRLAAERGTATHLFLQFCDFSCLDGTREAVDREAERLVSRGFLSAFNAELLRRDELVNFSRSALLDEIRKARTLHREQRFNVLMPASQFALDGELARAENDEKLLVQGVIDLFFEDSDGRVVLCDYKTDRLTRSERADKAAAAKKLIAAHSEQLGYYATALEQLIGRCPDRMVIYSLHLGDTIELL